MKTALREELSARAAEFELLPLLRLLAHLGYGPGQIVFATHASSVSQAALVHALEFEGEAEERVRVVLNLGMSSAQGLLPSYLWREVDEGDLDAQAFHRFLAVLEHGLLSRFVAASYPETDPRIFADFTLTKARYLQLLDLRAPAGLYGLFAGAFPELGVLVEKVDLKRALATKPIRLGSALLGGAAFGNRAFLPVDARRVVLVSDEERTAAGEPWRQEIGRRLDELVFPTLAPLAVDLEVFLLLTEQRSFARLDRESLLGFDQVFGGKGAHRRIRIFSGRVAKGERGHALERAR